MSSREKFEAWYMDNWGFTEDDHETLFERCPDSDEEYYRLGVRLAHHAWQAATSAMEAKIASLSAENTAMKSALKFAEPWIPSSDEELNHRIETATQTPDTDAFIAEQRAVGVEMLTAKLQSLIDEGNFEGDEIGMIAGAVYTGADIAEQLRQGCAS